MRLTKSSATKTVVLAVLLGALAAVGVAIAKNDPPPAPSISTSPANPTNQTSASFMYTDSQPITKFQCALDGAAFTDCGTTRPSSKSYPGPLAAGSHTFQVRAVASSGTSAATSFTWVVDRTAPTVSSITRAGASPTNAASVAWTVKFSEDVSGVGAGNFSLSSAGLTGTPTITSVAPASGTVSTWTVTASTGAGTPSGSGTLQLRLSSAGTIKDRAGNGLGGSLPFNGETYTIDKSGPAAPTITSGPSGFTPSTSASFAFTGETGATFGCALDSTASPATCASPKSYSSLSQGSHTFYVRQTDAAGNASTFASRSWTVDTVKPPKPQFTQTPPDPSPTTTSTFAWTDSESGVTFRCSKENGAYQACSSPLTYSVSGNGQHQFAVVAVDAAGNVSEPASYKWKVNQSGQGAPFTIAGNASGLLYPGVWRYVALTITNPNNVPIYVTNLTVAVTNSPNGCTNSTNIEVQQSSAAPTTNELVVPANATNWAVPQPFQPQIRLKDLPNNQDNCKSQTFSLSYTGSAHS